MKKEANPSAEDTKKISWIVQVLSIFFSGAWIEGLLDP